MWLFAPALVSLVVSVLRTDDPKPLSEKELAAISARGRDLAAYDAAAWHASDALQARQPREGSIVRYIARKTDKGWVVAFGRLNAGQDRFLVAYEAVQGKKPQEFRVTELAPPREDAGFYPAAARAIDTALEEFTAKFQGQKRPYNVAVLPADQGRFWVYLVPAATKQNVWPLGADVRYLVAPNGKTILEKRQLHKSVIEYDAAQKQGDQRPAAGIHTHVLSNVPEDTDVFHVLWRQTQTPELIVTQDFVYVAERDGTLKVETRTSELRDRTEKAQKR